MPSIAEIEGMLRDSPLSLLTITDEQMMNKINNLLPYSTGFDIECHKDDAVYDEASFRAIPDIMNVSNDSSEQRYRIPNGLRGIICLYNLSIQLKINSLLNPQSSVHYHIDCTDCFPQISKIIQQTENTDYILSQLDTWVAEDEDRSKVTNRSIGGWFKLNDLKTVEFRLGEMTFEYRWLLKRVIHCNMMVRKFKMQIEGLSAPTFVAPDAKTLLKYERANLTSNPRYKRLLAMQGDLENRLLKNKEEQKKVNTEIIQVRNRLHKLNTGFDGE